ncbi:hypothetical protein NYS52_12995 [Curtobacterium flaccumfaciens pv. flaccumfaciens]|uniref:hypothetical protein n=1 Tax=Curtobacterium TaxID=2034 RepID=UPI00111439EA|nr:MULTISPECIES: hypothetical protein [Curtobacterium]MCS6575447.1 hypothetical protein [Curtobacterium flaccumfaciens pv. flaccumfaciens]UXZ59213.1 hypothetical protein MXD64_07575 [Curtobacterium sp. Arg-1]
MPRSRSPRSALLGVVVAVTAVLTGCSSVGPDTDASEDPTSSDTGLGSGASPVVFAFVCGGDGADRASYTTYAAVWEAARADCSAKRLTGSVPSSQQQSAVTAARGDATLVELASACAVRDSAPWTSAVADERGAHVAEGLLRYCPGHPETDRLRDALAAYRG